MKLVLDTNVWLDLLVFGDPSAAFLREPRFEIVVDARCEAELARVLSYRFQKRTLSEDDQAACLRQFRALSTPIAIDEPLRKLPRCADPDDQKFLEVALAAGADALVTKDEALLRLARSKRNSGSDPELPFRIVRPADL